jgi:hypothetical protein
MSTFKRQLEIKVLISFMKAVQEKFNYWWDKVKPLKLVLYPITGRLINKNG